MAKRLSLLVYTDSRTPLETSQSADGDVLLRSEFGVPLLWIFCFGGRNIWEPGDDIAARGGAVGSRNIYETPVEVALTRLQYATSALGGSRYLWPFLCPLPILERRLRARGRQGFVRVVAPWILTLAENDLDRWRATTAFAENCVHHADVDRMREARLALRQFEAFCPFVPHGDGRDLDRMEKLKVYRDRPEISRLVALMIGDGTAEDVLQRGIERDVIPHFEKARHLEPLKEEPLRPFPDEEGASSSSLLGRVAGLFRRR